MVYSRGGIPVGDYSAEQGAWTLDNGFGYTHISMKLPVLNSLAVSALTYNFLNPHTDYQNGIDWHTDCAQVVPDQD
jgi:hypothetical protein